MMINQPSGPIIMDQEEDEEEEQLNSLSVTTHAQAGQNASMAIDTSNRIASSQKTLMTHIQDQRRKKLVVDKKTGCLKYTHL